MSAAAEAPFLAGVDIGTGHVRTLIFDVRGRKVSAASVATPTYRPQHYWAAHRPDDLWGAVVTTLRQAIAAAPDDSPIAGVAVTSFGEAAVPLDKNLAPVHDVIAWYDPRTEPQARRIAERIGVQRVFSITGLNLNPTFGLCKLMWLREHVTDGAARIRHWLNVSDWIAFRLSGVMATDFTQASRTLALDLGARRWSSELTDALDVPADILAEIKPFGSPLGPVQASAAAETGLPTTAIVGVGGHDHVCGALAEGITQPGSLLDSMGTAEALFVVTESPRFDETTRRGGFSQGAMTADRSYLMGALNTSGGAIEWFRDALAPGVDHADLIEAAEAVPAGSHGALFLPHLRFGSSGASTEAARGAYLGLTATSDRGVLFRALLEGLAFEARTVSEAAQRLAEAEPFREIRVTGGNTRNALLLAIKAAALGRPLVVSDRGESSSLGAAILGGLAAGVFAGIDDALARIEPATHIIEPHAEWQRRYADIYDQVYRHLEPALQPFNDALRRLN